MKFISLPIVAPLALVILLGLFQLSNWASSEGFYRGGYSGFSVLSWTKLNGCSLGSAPAFLYSPQATLSTYQVDPTAGRTNCLSYPFSIDSSQLELEIYQGFYNPGSNHKDFNYSIQLKDPAGGLLWERDLSSAPLTSNSNDWQRLGISLPPAIIGSQATIEIASADNNSDLVGWIAVRNRLNFHHPAPLLARIASRVVTPSMLPSISITTSLLLAFCLAAIMLQGSRSESKLVAAVFNNSRYYVLFLFILALAVHFRSQSYFYFDEWHVLERYSKLGIKGVIYTHNEHFLPLFFAFYYLESLLLGNSYQLYLILSAAIHALNAYLLGELIFRLGSFSTQAKTASRVLAVFFLLNALHSETLHWAFEQSLQCSITVTLIALIAGWDFIGFGGKQRLLVAAFCSSLAPLFFGNGFSSALLLGLIGLYRVFSGQVDFQATPRDLRPQTRIARVFVLGLLSAVLMLTPASLYLVNNDSAGHGVDSASPLEDVAKLQDYIVVGSQFGTVLRGIGLFPSLEPGAISGTYKEIKKLPLFALIAGDFPLQFFAYCGVAVSLFLLMICLLSKNRWNNSLLWLLGQLVVLSSLLLPALGRWQFGAEQSLSLRYHYGTLIGLVVILLPILLSSLEPSRSGTKKPILVLAIVSLVYFAHLRLALNFSYFTSQGEKHRRYAEQLHDWQLRKEKLNPGLAYEAAGSELAGLQPLFPVSITPGRHPNEIAAVLNWLKN